MEEGNEDRLNYGVLIVDNDVWTNYWSFPISTLIIILSKDLLKSFQNASFSLLIKPDSYKQRVVYGWRPHFWFITWSSRMTSARTYVTSRMLKQKREILTTQFSGVHVRAERAAKPPYFCVLCVRAQGFRLEDWSQIQRRSRGFEKGLYVSWSFEGSSSEYNPLLSSYN